MGLLGALWQDISSPAGRYAYLEWMMRNVPGEFANALRGKILGRWFQSAGEGLVVYPGARIHGAHRLTVGRDVRIGIANTIQASGGVVIGDRVLLGPGVKIWSVNHVFRRTDVPIWEQGYDEKKVTIGNDVWIGADCFVMPGANIGEGVVISAGSIVGGKDIEPYSIVAGNPARKIGTREDRADPAMTGQLGG